MTGHAGILQAPGGAAHAPEPIARRGAATWAEIAPAASASSKQGFSAPEAPVGPAGPAGGGYRPWL